MNTEKIIKKSISIWQIIQALIIAAIIGVATWLGSTLEELKSRVVTIESNKTQNTAQWRALTASSEKITENQIEIQVTQRVFKILLDQNKIDIKSMGDPESYNKIGDEPENDIKETKSEEKPLIRSREDRVDDYKEQHMIQQQQIQEQQMK